MQTDPTRLSTAVVGVFAVNVLQVCLSLGKLVVYFVLGTIYTHTRKLGNHLLAHESTTIAEQQKLHLGHTTEKYQSRLTPYLRAYSLFVPISLFKMRIRGTYNITSLSIRIRACVYACMFHVFIHSCDAVDSRGHRAG